MEPEAVESCANPHDVSETLAFARRHDEPFAVRAGGHSFAGHSTAICEACTTYLEQMRETIRLTGMMTQEQIPEDQKQRLLEAFRTWTTSSP